MKIINTIVPLNEQNNPNNPNFVITDLDGCKKVCDKYLACKYIYFKIVSSFTISYLNALNLDFFFTDICLLTSSVTIAACTLVEVLMVHLLMIQKFMRSWIARAVRVPFFL